MGQLLPNIGGPDDRIRCFYSGVVQSKFLYGAPVWSEQLLASRRNMLHAKRVQRRLAIRTIRGFRTISGEAASLLAGMTPLHLMAVERATTYQIACSIRRGELCPEGEELEVLRRQARQDILVRWREEISSADSDRPIVRARMLRGVSVSHRDGTDAAGQRRIPNTGPTTHTQRITTKNYDSLPTNT
ncbi:uncharacterized protein LOC143211638 [Lasioglossum baleicum]|uniref:uncharacterized protein LOC143211638 n=1 Tax=Lasioglossum baleicum TaxID=434251 RepID=UPI003FCC97DE